MIFDHQPKTGGTAITSWLSEVFGNGTVTNGKNIVNNNLELIEKYGGIFPILCGHIWFHLHEDIDPRYQYITLLRNPVDRCISHIFFLMHDVTGDIEIQSQIADAKTFVESNGQIVSNNFLGAVSNLYVKHFSSIGRNKTLSDEEMLAAAIKNIERYSLVGLYEEIDKFVLDIANLLHASTSVSLKKLNVTTRRPHLGQINSDIHQRLVDLNTLDIALFNYVTNNIVVRNKIQQLASPTSNIESFDFPINSYLASATPPIGNIELLSPIEQTVCNSGFHLLVCINNLGNDRWNGSAKFPISLSYHWLDSDKRMVLQDGERTGLPYSGIYPGSSLSMEMYIRAPIAPGSYFLVLTIVQDSVSWFELVTGDFIPSVVSVEVI